MTHRTVSPAAPSTETARLLACGVVAGPLFLAVLMIQAFTREGFDLSRHPLSLLSLGDLGWIQIANFVVTGALFVACAIGMRRVLRPGRSGTWAPRLVGAFGVGLIVAGVFTTDAGCRLPTGRTGRSAGADQLARHPARGRIRAGVPRDDRRVSGVRAPFRGPQAPGLGRSLRRDGGGGPRARVVARRRRRQRATGDRVGDPVRLRSGYGGAPDARSSGRGRDVRRGRTCSRSPIGGMNTGKERRRR